MEIKRTAECHCRQMKVCTVGEPHKTYVCHCASCQRRTGAAFAFGAFFPKDRVTIKGDFKSYERKSAKGTIIRFLFCPDCGSNLAWELDARPDTIGVAAASFNDPDFPPPTMAIWEEDRHSWFDLPTVTEHHQQSIRRSGD